MHIGVWLLATAVMAGGAGSAESVSERDFVHRVMRDPRVVAMLDEPLAQARAERARVGLIPDPEVGFDREALGGQPRQDTWSLSWTPPWDGRSLSRTRAARAGLEAAKRRHELSGVELRAHLRSAFADWALARDGAELGRQLATLTDRLTRQAEARASKGETSTLAARRLLLARIEVRAEAARLEAEFAHAAAEVRAWAPWLAAAAAPERPALPAMPQDSAAWSGSPRLAALDLDVRQAEATAAAAARSWALPELSYGRQTLRGGPGDVDGPVYGARWKLPLFDRGAGDRIEARGRLAAARARRELDRDRVRARYVTALAAYAALREAAELAAGAEPAATRVLASAAAIFEAGEGDATDLLETLRGVLAGRLAALDALGAALRAHRELELAAGRALTLTEGGE